MELELLEAAAVGDSARVEKLIAAGVNVNNKHAVNGWFAHFSCSALMLK